MRQRHRFPAILLQHKLCFPSHSRSSWKKASATKRFILFNCKAICFHHLSVSLCLRSFIYLFIYFLLFLHDCHSIFPSYSQIALKLNIFLVSFGNDGYWNIEIFNSITALNSIRHQKFQKPSLELNFHNHHVILLVWYLFAAPKISPSHHCQTVPLHSSNDVLHYNNTYETTKATMTNIKKNYEKKKNSVVMELWLGLMFKLYPKIEKSRDFLLST